MTHEETLYEAVGGQATFARLVDRFYTAVATDPVLRPMYPEDDLGPAAERMTSFLAQYWGGPKQYTAHRGHPRLRIRHAPFKIDVDARDRWLAAMRTALDELALPARHEAALWSYLQRAARTLVNQ